MFVKLLTDRDEMSNLHRGHSIDASCYASVNLAKRFQRRFLKIGQSETRITCGGPCLITDRDEMSKLYRRHNFQRGPTIDASYQVSLHLAEGFQRKRLKCEKLRDDGHQVMAKARWTLNTNQSHCLRQGELNRLKCKRLWTKAHLFPNQNYLILLSH